MNCGELATTAKSKLQDPACNSNNMQRQHLCTGPGISAICEIATDAMLNSIFRLPYPQSVRHAGRTCCAKEDSRKVVYLRDSNCDNLTRDELV